MTNYPASVRYAMDCAERDEWTEAMDEYRLSTGPEHARARRLAHPLVVAAIRQRDANRAALAAAARKQRAGLFTRVLAAE